jgi:penicillin-binding protein 2
VSGQDGYGRTDTADWVMTTTGRVVAMASYPDYDPSVWTGGISQRQFNALFGKSGGQPIINWTTQGQYAPGSTFKVTSTAAAVANGYPLYGLYDCPGSVTIAGHTFGNDGEPSLGAMTFNEALIQSCDTVYYNLGYGMYQHDNLRANGRKSPNAPVQKMQAMELAWGFGKNTGVDLPEESAGTIPTRKCSAAARIASKRSRTSTASLTWRRSSHGAGGCCARWSPSSGTRRASAAPSRIATARA